MDLKSDKVSGLRFSVSGLRFIWASFSIAIIFTVVNTAINTAIIFTIYLRHFDHVSIMDVFGLGRDAGPEISTNLVLYWCMVKMGQDGSRWVKMGQDRSRWYLQYWCMVEIGRDRSR